MSEMAKKAREAMKSKAARLTKGDPSEKVDSSTWSAAPLLNTEAQTGMRPISPRAYKRGGKVHGEHAKMNMGRKPRKAGGKAEMPLVDRFINRDMKKANDLRDGVKHIGGLKRGGKAHKAIGGPLAGAQQMMDRSTQQAGVPNALMGFTGIRKGQISPMRATGMKKGGMAAKHDDIKEDMALIRKMVKPEARAKRKDGGKTPSRGKGMDYAWDVEKTSTPAVKDMSDSYDHNPASYRDPKSTQTPRKYLEAAENPNFSETPGSRSDGPNYTRTPEKHGGRTKRKDGGGVFTGPSYPGKIPGVVPGGRTAHAHGGKTGKGKTDINIMIASGKPGEHDMMPNPMGGPTPPPPRPVPVPPPGAGGGMPMGGMPPGMPMPMPAPPAGGSPMPRKAGGRTYRSYKDMDAGAGGGEGRLEKMEIQSRKR